MRVPGARQSAIAMFMMNREADLDVNRPTMKLNRFYFFDFPLGTTDITGFAS